MPGWVFNQVCLFGVHPIVTPVCGGMFPVK